MDSFSIRRSLVITLITIFFLSASLSILPAVGANSVSTSPSSPSTATIQHVIIILMENHEYSAIIGNKSLPYENNLANTYALATNYFSVTHPSLPNYLALTGGTTFGLASDK